METLRFLLDLGVLHFTIGGGMCLSTVLASIIGGERESLVSGGNVARIGEGSRVAALRRRTA